MKNLNNLCNLAKHPTLLNLHFAGANLSLPDSLVSLHSYHRHSWSYLTEQVENILYHVLEAYKTLKNGIFQKETVEKGVFILIPNLDYLIVTKNDIHYFPLHSLFTCWSHTSHLGYKSNINQKTEQLR